MNNKNKVDGIRGSLAIARDDTGFLVRWGERSGNSPKCCLKMPDACELPLLSPKDPIYACHADPEDSVEESYNQLFKDYY